MEIMEHCEKNQKRGFPWAVLCGILVGYFLFTFYHFLTYNERQLAAMKSEINADYERKRHEIELEYKAKDISREMWLVSKVTTVKDGLVLTTINLTGHDGKQEMFTITRPERVEVRENSPETLVDGECVGFHWRYPPDRVERQSLDSYLLVERPEESVIAEAMIDDE